ncbi:MAG: hypothetical protein J2P41_08700 [Blastocatellia bacterium]|nr:hypothetical protein [Blastocatellia bacterium]
MNLSSQRGSASSPPQPKPAGFEYKIVPVGLGTDLKSGEALINEYDAEGWELIAVHSLTSTNGDKYLHFRGSFLRSGSPLFKATDLAVEAKKALDKADALYIFKRAKVGQ